MPLFSIIIPCYNSAPYIANTLESIVNQHMGDRIQVILVDDCSTESFDMEINPFLDKLAIKKIKTTKNLGPGMARQFGVDNADGDWVCFCDHDDAFKPNVFNKIRTIIRNNPSRNVIQTKFSEIKNGQIIPYSLEKGQNWIHGKFFRRSFLQENKLSFKDGLKTHEDIYYSILTRMATEVLGASVLQCEFETYYWYNRPESLSHCGETGLDLFENHFEDYVTSAFEPIEVLKDKFSLELILNQSISVILFIYFYMEGFNQLGRTHHSRNINLMKTCIKKLIKWTGISSKNLVTYIEKNPNVFCSIRENSFNSVGYFIETDDWKEIFYEAEKELNEKN